MTTPNAGLEGLVGLSERATPGEFLLAGSSVYALKHHSWKRGEEQFCNATYGAFTGDNQQADAEFVCALVNWFRANYKSLPQPGAEGVTWAQGLIEQLPADHDGRNSWLLNHGVGEESDWLRSEYTRYKNAWASWRQGEPQPQRRGYQAALASRRELGGVSGEVK